jgi:hypothetical protein
LGNTHLSIRIRRDVEPPKLRQKNRNRVRELYPASLAGHAVPQTHDQLIQIREEQRVGPMELSREMLHQMGPQFQQPSPQFY